MSVTMSEIFKSIGENYLFSLTIVAIATLIAIVLVLLVLMKKFQKQIAEAITRLIKINFSKSNGSSKIEFNAQLASHPDTENNLNNAHLTSQPVPDIKDKKNLEITGETLYSNVGVSQLLIEWETRVWEFIKEKYPALHADHHNNYFNKWLVRELTAAQITAEFELVYNFIYGTQIYLLKMINQVNAPMSEANIRDYFLAVQERFPDFYKNYEVNHYLTFLLNHSLIIHEEESYNITIRGVEFLGWMTKIGRNEDKSL